jgi:acetyl esterase/lipase
MTHEIIKLWEKDAPLYAMGGEIPTLVYYPAENKKGDGAVVICPGGGYNHKARHEGEGYARFLSSMGIEAFVLLYRHSPEHFFPCQLLDARRAVRYVRANAEKYEINPQKIAIMGSSAGGHLAALTSTYRGKIEGEGQDAIDEVDCIPSAQILCYPVITPAGHMGTYSCLVKGGYADGIKNRVNPAIIADKDTPPAFIWHTAEDDTVTVTNSYEYAGVLYRLGVPVEMHIYPFGPHGLGLATGEELGGKCVPHVQSWASLLIDWLKLYGYIGE